MTPSGRLAAAIDIVGEIAARRRPAADAMKDWGLGHRFAGSGDRAGIAGLLYDARRRKSSSAWLPGAAPPGAEILGALKQLRGLGVDEIAGLFTGEGHAPPPLRDAARGRVSHADLTAAPARARGTGAGRPARQHAEGRPDQGARRAGASQSRRDAIFAYRPAHRGAPRR